MSDSRFEKIKRIVSNLISGICGVGNYLATENGWEIKIPEKLFRILDNKEYHLFTIPTKILKYGIGISGGATILRLGYHAFWKKDLKEHWKSRSGDWDWKGIFKLVIEDLFPIIQLLLLVFACPVAGAIIGGIQLAYFLWDISGKFFPWCWEGLRSWWRYFFGEDDDESKPPPPPPGGVNNEDSDEEENGGIDNDYEDDDDNDGPNDDILKNNNFRSYPNTQLNLPNAITKEFFDESQKQKERIKDIEEENRKLKEKCERMEKEMKKKMEKEGEKEGEEEEDGKVGKKEKMKRLRGKLEQKVDTLQLE